MTATSAVVNITVNSAPAITTQPQNQTSFAGGTATFTVVATGTAPLTYQWRFNGNNLSGQTASSLVLQNLQNANAGAYSVVVANPYGSVTSAPASLVLSIIVGWGTNQWGQITIHPWMTNNIVSISAGSSFNAALRSDGTVTNWGFAHGNPPPGLSDVVAISAGGGHTLALRANRTVVAWGANDAGQTNVPANLSNIVAVAAGGRHSLALRANGTVVGWGTGNLGIEANIPAGLTNVKAIAGATFSSMALLSNGTVVVWGSDCCGETNVPPWLTDVVAIDGGDNYCLALQSSGTIVGWGFDRNGATATPGGSHIALAAGDRHGIAIRTDTTVAAWGGLQDPFFPNLDPPYAGQADVPPSLVNVIGVGGGDSHSIALIANDTNLWPNVYITSPVNNTTNAGPTNITITATATDWDGSVTGVQFYANGSLIGTDNASPYSIAWSNVTLGSYSLTARATDNLGGSKLSAPVTLRITASTLALADAHVRDGASANSNFGTATNLELRTSSSGNNRDSYLRFDISSFTGVTGARLRISAKLDGSGSVGTTAYVVTNTSWSETGITWNNKPALSNALGSATVSGSSFAWYEIDVTSHVIAEKAAGRNLISLALHNTATSTRMIQINSREATVNKPELILSSTNSAPAVTVTEPTNNAVFGAPADITITATASDADGSVAQVEFFQGVASLGVRTSSPYTLVWSNVSAGTYVVTARATDNLGTTKTSDGVTVIVDSPPSVTLTSPANNDAFVQPTPINLAATATDSDGTVSKVEFFAGTNEVGEATSSPFTAIWSGAAVGAHSLTARATDNLGILATSAPVNITVYAAPTNSGLSRLGYWRFENTNWLGEQGQIPLAFTNVQNVAGLHGNALHLDSGSAAFLKYREVENSGAANIDVRNGTIVFSFNPNWSSSGAGGTGPGAVGQLLSVGQFTTNASIGCWNVSVSADGNSLSFVTQTNGATATNLIAPVSFQSNQWYQVALAYTPSNSALYINAAPVGANGAGVTLYPDALTRAVNGFNIGSDRNGSDQARGRFDTMETFNYPLTASEISQRPDTDGDGLPDGWETQYGLDPNSSTGNNGANGDPDGDGLLNIEEWIFGTNPTVNDLPSGSPGLIRIFTPLE
jgi:alpha-tubulin suppressor-like RCC1 family protein